jgi:hypothetical protein
MFRHSRQRRQFLELVEDAVRRGGPVVEECRDAAYEDIAATRRALAEQPRTEVLCPNCRGRIASNAMRKAGTWSTVRHCLVCGRRLSAVEFRELSTLLRGRQ